MHLKPHSQALDAFSERERATMLAVTCLPRGVRPCEVEHLATMFRLVEQAGVDSALRNASTDARRVQRCRDIVDPYFAGVPRIEG